VTIPRSATSNENENGAEATPENPSTTKPGRPKPKQLPPYKVLLHNDDKNDFGHVIRSIAKLTTLSLEEALQKTLEAHETGVSLLLVTHRERAELYCEQFATFQLTATYEPDA
jgi:ATP-dependent Clp protease adaptor protein ClpS